MALYKNSGTAMVIFAKATNDNYIETPNTINPDGSNMPFNPPNPNTPDIDGALGTQKKKLTFTTLKKAVVGIGAIQALRSTANYFKNNYGEIMQDSNAQARINEIMSLVNIGTSIGVGFAVGGVVGGVASLVASGTQIGLQTASFQRSLYRNNVQSQIMMARTNYASINGGR